MLEKYLEQRSEKIAGKEIWVYGIGNSMDIYQNGLKRLSLDIAGYCVDSEWISGEITQYNGKPVFDIAELVGKNICILVHSFNLQSAHKMLEKATNMGFETHFLDAVVLADNKTYVMETYNLLKDEVSKRIYEEIIGCRVNGNYPCVGTWTSDQYFCWNEFTMKPIGNVFVDCGCYVGDSIEKYIWYKDGLFKKIYGFEPDEVNQQSLQYRIDRLSKEWNVYGKIQIENAGVGAKTETLSFMRYNEGLGSVFSSEKGDVHKKIYALDDYLTEQCDFIKADIESYEYDMLLGACNSIKRWHPNLAICVYHNAVDMFSIAPLIKHFYSGYRFALRHHSNTLSETVLYAWAE